MLNDDYTPMEFVVLVLEMFFQIGREAAVEIMMTVHLKGAAVTMPDGTSIRSPAVWKKSDRLPISAFHASALCRGPFTVKINCVLKNP